MHKVDEIYQNNPCQWQYGYDKKSSVIQKNSILTVKSKQALPSTERGVENFVDVNPYC